MSLDDERLVERDRLVLVQDVLSDPEVAARAERLLEALVLDLVHGDDGVSGGESV